MYPPGPATGLQARDKAAEAKTQPDVGSGGATAYLAGEISQTLNAEPCRKRGFGYLLVCFAPAEGGEEQKGGCGRACSG